MKKKTTHEKFWNESGLYDKVLRRLLNTRFTDDQADAIIDSIEDVLVEYDKFY